jgi:transitional endoplasmic reticulum ATPase
MPVQKKRRAAQTYSPPVSPELSAGRNRSFLKWRICTYLQRLFRNQPPQFDRETYGVICFAMDESWIEELRDSLSLYLPKTQLARLNEDLEEADDEDDVALAIMRTLKRSSNRIRRRFEREIVEKLGETIRDYDLLAEAPRTISQVEANINTTAEIFGLTDDERELLLFLLIMFIFDEAERFFIDHLSADKPFFRQNLATPLDMSIDRLNDALYGKLYRLELIDISIHTMSLNDSFLEILENPEKALTSRNSFTPVPDSGLELDAHLVNPTHIRILEQLLRDKPDSSTHILLYGPPGTGKTSFARALVNSLDISGYEIVNNEQNSSALRRGAVLSCIHFTNGGRGSVIVVDEADSLLSTRQSWFESGETRDKGWVNHLLEQDGLRMIWIVNTLSMDESIYRRFAYSVQFQPFTRKQRISVWHNVLARRGAEMALTDGDVEALATRYEVSAGGIELAVRKAAEVGLTAPDEVRTFLDQTLMAHLTLIHEGRRPPLPISAEAGFMIDGLNIKTDLSRLIDEIRAWNIHHQDPADPHPRSLSLLFYGPPGTGKSETAKYLAEVMDRDLMARKASDILDMFVGGTEKNLSSIFSEAEDRGAVLMIDEVDSFLINRKRALRSYEITQTNEFLSQLENFRGIVICSTNQIPELDHAAFRRFNRKIGFGYLTGRGNLRFYETFLASFAEGPLEGKDKKRLAAIQYLAPGDFKVVRNQAFLDVGESLSHSALIDALEAESRFKSDERSGAVAGFTTTPKPAGSEIAA